MHSAAVSERLPVLVDLVAQNHCNIEDIDAVRTMIAFEVPDSIRPLAVASSTAADKTRKLLKAVASEVVATLKF